MTTHALCTPARVGIVRCGAGVGDAKADELARAS